jgi:hypothetical protein
MKNFLLTLWYFPSHLWYNYKSWRYEQKCIKYFGAKPEKIILSKENFDALVERLNEPSDPESIEKIKRVLQRKAPWDE